MDTPKRGRPFKNQQDTNTIPEQPEDSKREVIEIDKASFEALQKQVQLLTKAADKSKLARYTEQGVSGRDITIGVYRNEGKDLVVMSWKKIRDDVRITHKDDIEDQQLELTLEDNSKVVVQIKHFNQTIEKEKIILDMKKTTFEEQEVNVEYMQNKFRLQTFKTMKTCVFTYKGKEYKIDADFINPY